MKNQKKISNHNRVPNRLISSVVVTLALSAQMPLAAHAGGDGDLKADVPTIDTTPAAITAAATTAATATSTVETTTLDPAARDASTTTLTGAVETAVKDETSPAFKIAIQKLAARQALTSDDYRSLGIGIIGYESNKPFFSSSSTITDLFPGCPAAEAGIKVGDVETSLEDPEAQKDTHGLTMFICGLAGKPVTITIKRRGHELHFRLVRMNVEDIPDDGLRKSYERMIRRMGQKLVRAYPQLDPKTVGQ